MGMYHSTYFGYGILIPVDGPPWQEAERLEEELKKLKDQCPDVGYLQAGNYDDDMTFLVTTSDEIDLGTYKFVSPETHSAEHLADWDRQLATAIDALGYREKIGPASPGWLCVPDLS